MSVKLKEDKFTTRINAQLESGKAVRQPLEGMKGGMCNASGFKEAGSPGLGKLEGCTKSDR